MVEADTIEEAIALLQRVMPLVGRGGRKRAIDRLLPAEDADNEEPATPALPPPEEIVLSPWAKLLELLHRHEDGRMLTALHAIKRGDITLRELSRVLQLASGQAAAGCVSGIAKNCAKVGLHFEDVIKSRRTAEKIVIYSPGPVLLAQEVL